MLLLLLACAPDPADSGADGAVEDTAVKDTAETGDTAAASPWEPPALSCTLVDPRSVDLATLSPLTNLYGPSFLDPVVLSTYFEAYAEDWGCPAVRSTEWVETWSGSCTTDGMTWAGAWTTTAWGGSVGEAYQAESGVAVRYTDRYYTGYDVAYDGISAWARDEDGAETIERDFRLSLGGYEHPERGGSWDVTTLERYVYGASYTMDGRYSAVPDEGEPGDYCLFAEAFRDRSCDLEPWGGWVLVGAETLVVTWDPHVTCDGCGAATLDGVPVGEVCDDFLAWVY
ncbi:MAG: hypothetical protein ACK4YP_21025 [Myxococcota bacterium]